MTGKAGVPVLEGLFTWPSDSPQLIGTRCLSCGSYFFPRKRTCSNPNCKEKKVEEALLSTRGELWSYTVQPFPPPPPYKIERQPPYAFGLVELPEGIRVVGLIDCEIDKIKVGMALELVVDTFYHDEQGREVVNWQFRPVK